VLGTRRKAVRFLAAVALLAGPALPAQSAEADRPLALRLELLENTAEGPAFERCSLDGLLGSRSAERWRILYGEARASSSGGWEGVRARSACQVISGEEGAPAVLWTSRFSPFLVVDLSFRLPAPRRETFG